MFISWKVWIKNLACQGILLGLSFMDAVAFLRIMLDVYKNTLTAMQTCKKTYEGLSFVHAIENKKQKNRMCSIQNKHLLSGWS